MKLFDLIRGVRGHDVDDMVQTTRAMRRHPEPPEPVMRAVPKGGARLRRWKKQRARSLRRSS